jgi:hypothetical protein
MTSVALRKYMRCLHFLNDPKRKYLFFIMHDEIFIEINKYLDQSVPKFSDLMDIHYLCKIIKFWKHKFLLFDNRLHNEK